MNVLQSILYGLVSGLSEFLPVSAQAHQAILLRLFGMDERQPLMDLMIHIGALLALYSGCRAAIARIRREKAIVSNRRMGRRVLSDATYELRLLRSATLPMLLVQLLYLAARGLESSMPSLALLLLVNGAVLFVPDYFRQANKDARQMTGFDGILIGIFGGLSALPGISRIGAISAYGLLRGADKQKLLNWALLLSIPALALHCVMDVVLLFTAGVGSVSFLSVIGYLFSGAAAFLGAYLGIIFIRFLTVRTGYSAFSYYCLGGAMFAMVLYLIV